jgi:hypothetical protein
VDNALEPIHLLEQEKWVGVLSRAPRTRARVLFAEQVDEHVDVCAVLVVGTRRTVEAGIFLSQPCGAVLASSEVGHVRERSAAGREEGGCRDRRHPPSSWGDLLRGYREVDVVALVEQLDDSGALVATPVSFEEAVGRSPSSARRNVVNGTTP